MIQLRPPVIELGKRAPIGVNCWPVELSDGTIFVAGRTADRTAVGAKNDGEYHGSTPFKVARNDLGDVVMVGRVDTTVDVVAEEEYVWIGPLITLWHEFTQTHDNPALSIYDLTSANPNQADDGEVIPNFGLNCMYTSESGVQTFSEARLCAIEYRLVDGDVAAIRIADGNYRVTFDIWQSVSYYIGGTFDHATDVHDRSYNWDFTVTSGAYWPGAPGLGSGDPMDIFTSWITGSGVLVGWPTLNPTEILTGIYDDNGGDWIITRERERYATFTKLS